SLLVLALAAPALAWRFSYGSASANRVAAGQGTFPRVVVISTPAEAPFRWVVSMPPKRLAAVDSNGTLWIFEIAQTSLAVIGRYGDAASPDGPPVAVSLGDGRPGIVCVSRQGLLLVWPDGALRAFAVGSNALSVRGRYVVPEPAVLEDLIPMVVPIGEGRRPGVVAVKSAPRQGSSILVLGWRDASLEFLAEGPAFGQKNRWVHVIGAADLSGDGIPELIAVNTPHLTGVLVAYNRRAAALIPSAKALGYSSHAFGSRNQDQAAIANMSG